MPASVVSQVKPLEETPGENDEATGEDP